MEERLAVQVCFKSAGAAVRVVTHATLMPLEVCRRHIAVTTSGMELVGGSSKRLPCNVKSVEMDHWIWICEGLVIMFSTETCRRLLSSVKRGREGRSNARASTQVEDLAIHPFSRDTLG